LGLFLAEEKVALLDVFVASNEVFLSGKLESLAAGEVRVLGSSEAGDGEERDDGLGEIHFECWKRRIES
jgi:hypothetical protein